MTVRAKFLAGCAAMALTAVLGGPGLAADTASLTTDQTKNDWLTHHGTYKSYHYSGLDQINATNVKNLEVAWTHFPGRTTRGLQSTPLVADGVLYYSGSYSRVYALDGATGKVLWRKYTVPAPGEPGSETWKDKNNAWQTGGGAVWVTGTYDPVSYTHLTLPTICSV